VFVRPVRSIPGNKEIISDRNNEIFVSTVTFWEISLKASEAVPKLG
jgi:PIN domain nuclease of toxin-antitoxin system